MKVMNISRVIFAKTSEKYLFNFVIVWIKNIKYREWKKKIRFYYDINRDNIIDKKNFGC